MKSLYPTVQALVMEGPLQIPRILDAANSNVDVALIAPIPLDPDVESYWLKLLQVGGVADPHTRFRAFYPVNTTRLPSRMSLAARLLASPATLKRLKLFIHSRPAYIVPGSVTSAELDLAVELGIPVLGPHPATFAALSTRAARGQMFAAAALSHPVEYSCALAGSAGESAENRGPNNDGDSAELSDEELAGA